MRFQMSFNETKKLMENPTREFIDRIKYRLLISDDPQSDKVEFLNRLALLEMGLLEAE